MTSTRHPGSGSVSARETSVVEACQVLTSLVTESADRKPIFLAEDGVIALLELLEERSTKVTLCTACACPQQRTGVMSGRPYSPAQSVIAAELRQQSMLRLCTSCLNRQLRQIDDVNACSGRGAVICGCMFCDSSQQAMLR